MTSRWDKQRRDAEEKKKTAGVLALARSLSGAFWGVQLLQPFSEVFLTAGAQVFVLMRGAYVHTVCAWMHYDLALRR